MNIIETFLLSILSISISNALIRKDFSLFHNEQSNLLTRRFLGNIDFIENFSIRLGPISNSLDKQRDTDILEISLEQCIEENGPLFADIIVKVDNNFFERSRDGNNFLFLFLEVSGSFLQDDLPDDSQQTMFEKLMPDDSQQKIFENLKDLFDSNKFLEKLHEISQYDLYFADVHEVKFVKGWPSPSNEAVNEIDWNKSIKVTESEPSKDSFIIGVMVLTTCFALVSLGATVFLRYRNNSKVQEDELVLSTINKEKDNKEKCLQSTCDFLKETSVEGSTVFHGECLAPPGKLGVAIDNFHGTPVVHKIKPGSPLDGVLFCQDKIVRIDNIDTSSMSASEVTKLMVTKMTRKRKITYIRERTKTC